METNWPLYETLISGGQVEEVSSARDSAIEDAIEMFLSGMKDDPSYQANATVNGHITPMLATRTSSLVCEIVLPPKSDIHIGDLLYCLDEYWIVTDLYADKIGKLKGSVYLCNCELKFQNGTSYIHSRHCVIDDGSFAVSNASKPVYIADGSYKLYMSGDEQTYKMYIDKRLGVAYKYNSFGEKILEVYKIVGTDQFTKNHGEGSHLLTISLKKDVYNTDTDDLENMICDVILEEEKTDDEEEHIITMIDGTISGKDSVRLGTTRKYTATYDMPDILSESLNWNIDVICDPSIKYSTSNNVISLSIPMKDDIVGSTILITAKASGSEYNLIQKEIEVVPIG